MVLKLSALLFFSGLTAAHTTIQYAFVGGEENNEVIRQVSSNNPVQDVTSPDLACNVDGDAPASATAEVPAGSPLTFEWHHEGRESDAIAESHKGPVLTYMAAVDSAASESNPSGLDWFKIAETGLDGSTWAVDTLNENGGKWEFEIPAAVPDGEYLVRQELIALHSAGQEGEAQFYIGCAQVKVTGGGSGSPSTVKIPGVYSASDPGILVSIYDQSGEPYPESYEIPGPPVFEA